MLVLLIFVGNQLIRTIVHIADLMSRNQGIKVEFRLHKHCCTHGLEVRCLEQVIFAGEIPLHPIQPVFGIEQHSNDVRVELVPPPLEVWVGSVPCFDDLGVWMAVGK